MTSQACSALRELLAHNVEAQMCEMHEFCARASQSRQHESAASILSHYQETCGFGDVSHMCRMFWLGDVIARLRLQLQHSRIDIDDAMMAASEAHQQEADAGDDGCCADVLLSGVASLMWRHLRDCMVVGHVLIAANRLAEAEEMFRFCFLKRRAVVGASHPDTLKSQHALAEALFWGEKFAEASAIAKECCSLRRAALGASHSDSLASAYARIPRRSNLAAQLIRPQVAACACPAAVAAASGTRRFCRRRHDAAANVRAREPQRAEAS